MSTRLFSFLLAAIVFILVASWALWSGGTVDFTGGLEAVSLTVLVPFFGAMLAIRSWFAVIDGKVADGSLPPGDNVALFTVKPFYLMLLAVGASSATIFGLPFISEATQTILVDGFVLGAGILLETFGSRLPSDPITVETHKAFSAQRAQARSAQKRE